MQNDFGRPPASRVDHTQIANVRSALSGPFHAAHLDVREVNEIRMSDHAA